jgi:hypothetical protein
MAMVQPFRRPGKRFQELRKNYSQYLSTEGVKVGERIPNRCVPDGRKKFVEDLNVV